jgi:hypothetical protein
VRQLVGAKRLHKAHEVVHRHRDRERLSPTAQVGHGIAGAVAAARATPQPAIRLSLQAAVAAAHETAEKALQARERGWQNFNDTNLAELARQKAAAENRADRADAALRRVFDGAAHSMYTAARLSDAAKESSRLMAKAGQAVKEIVHAEGDALPLEAAFSLSVAQAKYAAVASRFQINEPDFLAAHKFLLETRRAYLAVSKAE